MARSGLVASTLLVLVGGTWVGLLAQSGGPGGLSTPSCQLGGAPDALGSDGYGGDHGHRFDYWSDAGSMSGKTQFQHLVRNTGQSPLTFEWLGAHFFREGVPAKPPNNEARSECREDGNPANVGAGIIKYGPATQFSGPNARFYTYQPKPASASAGAGTFDVRWRAELPTGFYEVNFRFQTTAFPSDRAVDYSITNSGRTVFVEWPAVLTPAVLQTAAAQNAGLELRGQQLRLVASGVLRIQLRGVGAIDRRVGPLTVYTENGTRLYTDLFTGFGI